MISVLDSLTNELDHTKNYLQYLLDQESILHKNISTEPDSSSKALLQQLHTLWVGSRSATRQQVYAGVIVSLYGYFEYFVESLIDTYIRNINGIYKSHHDLPDTIKSNHQDLTLQVLQKKTSSAKYSSISDSDLIANLYSCHATPQSFKLNSIVFKEHGGNYQTKILVRSFSNIGIENFLIELVSTKTFANYLINHEPTYEHANNEEKKELLTSRLDNFVSRRNEIAHGAPTDLLTKETLINDWIPFIASLGEAIFEVLSMHVLRALINADRVVEIGNPIQTFPRHSSFGISIQNQKISVGDSLIFVNESGKKHVRCTVNSLQIDGRNFSQLQANTDARQVGIGVDIVPKMNHKVYLINNGY